MNESASKGPEELGASASCALPRPDAGGAVDEGLCFHCRLPLPAGRSPRAPIGGRERGFCCEGCRAVCEAIHAAGLEGFYQRAPLGVGLAPPPEPPRELHVYDLDAVQGEFVADLGPVREIQLLVEGIHCAACVWLIEKSLLRLPGVSEARVNLTGRRLRVVWDNRLIALSGILGRLAEIGYTALPFDPQSMSGPLERRRRALLYRLAFAGFAMMNLLWISVALYAGADRGEFRTLFQWLGFLIATPTLAYAGYPFFWGAINGLRSGHLSMDLPIALGASITYLFSLHLMLAGGSEVYWDTVVNLMFVILLGRYLESTSRYRAASATQRLFDLQPKTANVLRGGSEVAMPVRAVQPGERVLVRAGETVPVDGLVLEGESQVDEAMLTGESVLVPKGPGTRVAAGTLNRAGVLEIRTEGVLRDTALGRIIRLVEDAQASKAPIQALADRIVPWFVAATLGLALTAFLWWAPSDRETALMAAAAVLIVTCPCALGLATPMAIAVAAGVGSRAGILVKSGAALEKLASVDQIVFDKTGTLTEGQPILASIHGHTGRVSDPAALAPALRVFLGRLAALERYSEHPLASAVAEFCKRHAIAESDAPIREVGVRPGRGIRGRVGAHLLVAGTAQWLREQGIDGVEALLCSAGRTPASSGTLVLAAEDGRALLLLVARDPVRPDAPALLRRLREQGLSVSMLTGDRQGPAAQTAAELGGIGLIAEVLPEDKGTAIAELQRRGHRVAMVGDGINDAPALVRADVGIAMGSGTDVSIASADIVLLGRGLARLEAALELSRRMLSTIRQNLGISLIYNLCMVPLAMAAVVTPLIAAIAMPLSSLAVIGNSARLRRHCSGSPVGDGRHL